MLKIAIGQINTTACDIAGNIRKHKFFWQDAEARKADLIVFPEQSLSGYSLEDMAKNPDVLASSLKGLENLLAFSKGKNCAAVVGLPQLIDGKIYNTACLIENGEVKHTVLKQHLPNFDVFDEKRIYSQGPRSTPVSFRDHCIGICICEDLWHEDVVRDLTDKGADIIIAPNASPYYTQKHQHRIDNVLRARTKEANIPILYVNQVGGQDEVVFDGYSTAINSDRRLAFIAKNFEEDLHVMTLVKDRGKCDFLRDGVPKIEDPLPETWKALVLGLRDYFQKTGFRKAILGMSGGIDSAVVAAIAVDALGAENVELYKLPSKYSSDHSIKDAEDAAKLLGVKIEEIPIQGVTDEFLKFFSGGVTEENIQARVRGIFLMAASNKYGSLLLSTGNKSEVSVGYSTLYGDMNGGFNPLKDVYKMQVYALAEMRNVIRPAGSFGPDGPVVPENIIKKKPSAELRPGQTDDQSLPPYPVLDQILHKYIEEDLAITDIVADTGFEKAMVEDIVNKVDIAEFKRRQACPGVKVTEKSFGKGRRVPIAKPTLPRMIGAMEQALI